MFTLSCFLAKFVRSLASCCWVYKGEDSRCRSQNVVLGIVFICSMENVVCVCAASLIGTYIQQLCEDTGCSPEDLPEAMNDREKWRERVKDICTCGTAR